MPAVRRHVARVVLLDPANRVLLLPMESHLAPDGRRYWYLPGGAIEEGEEPVDAVRREIREELGLDIDVREPALVHLLGVRFAFGGQRIHQDEWHFLGRTSTAAIGEGRPGDPESRAVTAHRWWPFEALTSTTETVYPGFLPALILELQTDGPPATPRQLRNTSIHGRRNRSRGDAADPAGAGPTRRNPAAS